MPVPAAATCRLACRTLRVPALARLQKLLAPMVTPEALPVQPIRRLQVGTGHASIPACPWRTPLNVLLTTLLVCICRSSCSSLD